MLTSLRFALVVGGIACLAPSVFAQKTPPEVQDALNQVRKHLDQLENGKGAGELTPRNSGAVAPIFNKIPIIIVRFRVFPVARVMPEGLRASNIFAVTAGGKLEHLKDVKTLETFFRANAPAVKNEKDAKAVLAAWLELTQEFHQDGLFKFEVLNKEFSVAEEGQTLVAAGRAVVMQGGNGDLNAVLYYGKDGKLARAVETAKLRAGPRPICQATKLLDADPLVRRIAEQDLLIMGLSARDYLMEQRERATPELREAIDRVWRQIQKNGW